VVVTERDEVQVIQQCVFSYLYCAITAQLSATLKGCLLEWNTFSCDLYVFITGEHTFLVKYLRAITRELVLVYMRRRPDAASADLLPESLSPPNPKRMKNKPKKPTIADATAAIRAGIKARIPSGAVGAVTGD
jgi:hypothetical protein